MSSFGVIAIVRMTPFRVTESGPNAWPTAIVQERGSQGHRPMMSDLTNEQMNRKGAKSSSQKCQARGSQKFLSRLSNILDAAQGAHAGLLPIPDVV
jgi:hypothetical protein